jgi:hypothetical protein
MRNDIAKMFRSVTLITQNMSLRYNNVQTCTVPETHGHCFILPITFFHFFSAICIVETLAGSAAAHACFRTTAGNDM